MNDADNPTVNNQPVAITSFKQLLEAATAVRTFQFELNTRSFTLQIRPLNAEEAAMLDKIDGDILPPREKGTDRPLLDDAGYRAKMDKALRIKRVTAFDMALISFKLDGDSIDEKIRRLYSQMPPGVIEEIWRRILEITGNPIDNGLFISSDGSTNTPS